MNESQSPCLDETVRGAADGGPSTLLTSRSRPIPLGFIAGAGYSGSTLTAFILNTHPTIFSPGEMGPVAAFERDDYPCSCGAALIACPFFASVAETMSRKGVDFDLRHWRLNYRFSRNPYVERLLRLAFANPRVEMLHRAAYALVRPYRRLVASHHRRLHAFVQAVLEMSGKEICLDATKAPARVSGLRRIPAFNLRVIHLVRDPRGYCNSARRRLRQSLPESAHVWVRTNLLVHRQIRALAADTWIRVRYESLCGDPEREFPRVAAFLGADGFQMPDDFRACSHHIIGNKMRLPADGRSRVIADETWKTDLSADERRYVAKVSGPLARR